MISTVLNIIIRVILLTAMGILLIIYLTGIAANIFGWLEMRRSDEKLQEIFDEVSGKRAEIDQIGYNDGSISVAQVIGSEDSAAVIFVHGSPGSLDAFTGYLLDAHLQTHASLYSYDRLGYGQSTPLTAGKSLVDHSEQLFALAQRIPAKRKIYVGHSLGCSIMARLAMDHPEVVQGLVMIAAPIDPELEPSSWWRPIFELPMIRIAMPRSFVISNRELVPLKKDLEACLPLWDRVRCPVVFIHGDLDRLVPVENVYFGRKVLTNARVTENIMKGKAHFILWTEMEMIVDEVVRLLEGE